MANIDKELNQIKNAVYGREVRGSIHDGIDKINKEVESTTDEQETLSETFKQLVIDEGNSNAEIVASRGNEDWLPDRLNSVDQQLAHEVQQRKEDIQELDKEKAGRAYVDDQFSKIGSAKPSGAFSTLSDLETAYPNGNDNIYVVSDDNNWYFWNGSNWQVGGLYNATVSNEFPATNIISNGDFQSLTGWEGSSGSTLTAVDNVLTIKHSGSGLSPGVYQTTDTSVKSGDKIYTKLKVRTHDDKLTVLRMNTRVTQELRMDLEPITVGQWSKMSTITEMIEQGELDFYFNTLYGDGLPVSTEIKTDLQYVLIINLTEVFGKGKEPTKDEMDGILNKFPHSWFGGTISPLLDQKEIFNYYRAIDNEQTILNKRLSDMELNIPIPKQPNPPKIIPTLENGWLKYPGFSKRYRALDKDGNLYATTHSRVEKSTDIDNADKSESWQVLWEADTGSVGGVGVTALMVTNTNRIVVCSQFGRVFVSDENQENFTDVGIQMPFLDSHYSWCHYQFGYGHYENLVWVSSYGHNGIVANKAYLSKDYGASWEEMTDLPYINHTHNIHVHDLQYDPYQDRFWCVFGDADNANTFYSDDYGETWNAVFGLHSEDTRNVQYTSIVCFEHGVVFGSDQTGIDDRLDYWPRKNNVDPNDFKTIYYPEKGAGFISFALSVWQGVVGDNLVTLMPWYGLSGNTTFLLASIDGKRWFEIYRGKQDGGWQIAGISPKDKENRILGFDNDADGNLSLMRMPLPKWINSY